MQDHQPYRLDIGQCFREGWDYFKRHPFLIIGTVLMLYLLMFVMMMILFTLYFAFGGLNVDSPVPFVLAYVLLLVLIAPLMGGIHRFILNAARDTSPQPTDVFSGYRRYGTLLGAYFIWVVISIIGMAPTWLTFLFFTFSPAESIQTAMIGDYATTPVMPAGFWILQLVMLLNAFLLLLLLARFVMVWFVIMEDPAIGVIDAFRRSAAISRGNTWRLIGLYVLSGLIFIGLAMLLIIPAITLGMFLVIVYGRAYINLKEGHDALVSVSQPTMPTI